MTMTMTEHENALRAWARGLLPLEAATELLIRAGFAGEGRPWVHYDEVNRRPWVDFAAIPELIGGLSGGQKRLLRIAASIGADSPVILGDEITGLDRRNVDLVLAALAHAAGVHEASSTIEVIDGTPKLVQTTAGYAWPA